MTDNRHQRAAPRAPGARAGRRRLRARRDRRRAVAAPRAPTSLAEQFARGVDARRLRRDVLPTSTRPPAAAIAASEFAGAYAAGAEHRDRDAPDASRARARARRAGRSTVPVRVDTRLFGDAVARLHADVIERAAKAPRVVWSRSLAFPGLRAGEQLSRAHDAAPARDAARARRQRARRKPTGERAERRRKPRAARRSAKRRAPCSARSGRSPPRARQALEAEGVPAQTRASASAASSCALDDRLRGTARRRAAGGHARVLAYAAPRAAPRRCARPSPPRCSAPPWPRSAASRRGRRDAARHRADPGGRRHRPRRPAAARLDVQDGHRSPACSQAQLATPHTVFPYATYATLDGVKLNNANGEECGGTLELAFAVSCNSVFTPLGVKLGARAAGGDGRTLRLQPRTRRSPARPRARCRRPARSRANWTSARPRSARARCWRRRCRWRRSRRRSPTAAGARSRRFLAGAPRAGVHGARAPRSRARVRRLMIGVVREGTGTAAAIPGRDGRRQDRHRRTEDRRAPPRAPPRSEHAAEAKRGGNGQGSLHGSESEASNTDAWFAAFAPALHPRIAVCVMLVKDGAGGDTRRAGRPAQVLESRRCRPAA